MDSTPIILAPDFALQHSGSTGGYTLVSPAGAVRLTALAGEILTNCDGSRTAQEIIAGLGGRFRNANFPQEARDFLAEASRRGWVVAR